MTEKDARKQRKIGLKENTVTSKYYQQLCLGVRVCIRIFFLFISFLPYGLYLLYIINTVYTYSGNIEWWFVEWKLI